MGANSLYTVSLTSCCKSLFLIVRLIFLKKINCCTHFFSRELLQPGTVCQSVFGWPIKRATVADKTLSSRSSPPAGTRWDTKPANQATHPFTFVPNKLNSQFQKKKKQTQLSPPPSARVFYIFTIIKKGTRSFTTLKRAPTYLALL